jgi:hypothetical protein
MAQAPKEYSIVGKQTPRIDAYERVTAQQRSARQNHQHRYFQGGKTAGRESGHSSRKRQGTVVERRSHAPTLYF